MEAEAALPLGHHHHHHATGTGWILRASLAATLAFTALEIYAGLRSGSLALLSDAGHNFTDALALLLAAVGLYLQGKPANQNKTYGYQRAGVVAAFLNAATLIVISLIIFWEAIGRMIHPQAVNEQTMIWVAAIALVMNGAIMLALHRGQKGDINIRAAFIHMMGDALGAVAIIIGAVAMRYTGWTYIDPVLSIALRRFDYLHRLGHYWRIVEHTAGRAAARAAIAKCHPGHERDRRRFGCSRSAHLEPWFKHSRLKFARLD